ncbi:MAG: hypothetical protein ACPGLY_24205 [Rubripirellula sp.]
MLGIIKRLFAKSTPDPETESVIKRIDPQDSLDTLPDGTMLCVFRDTQLVNHCRDALPSSREDNEVWYLLPNTDLELQAELDLQDRTLIITTTVRLEPESELWILLGQRDSLTQEDLTALVTSQLSGLIDDMQVAAADSIKAWNATDKETFRARLSLLLQSRGIRCTGIEDIQVASLKTSNDEASQADQGTANGDIHDKNLASAISEVKNEQEWSNIMAALDAEGCEFDSQSAVKAEALGQQVIQNRITSSEAVSQLRHLADEARANLVPRAERLAMRGLDIRLADFDLPFSTEEADGPAASISARVKRASNAAWRLNLRRRPWTWWMLDRQKIDYRLRCYLENTLGHVRSALESERTIGSFQPYFADLRKLDQRLGICLDQLAATPTLLPNIRKMKLDRVEIKAAVKSVESAVRACETVNSQTKRLQNLPPGEADWKKTCHSISAALDRLSQDLRNRNQLHQ